MEESTVSFRQLATTSKHFARRLLTIGENRLELLTVEVQEERERLLHAFLLALGVATFGLLAGLTLTAAIVVLLWACSPWPCFDFDRPLRRCRDLSLPAAHRRDAQLADAFRLARTTPKGPRMSGKNSRMNPLESRKQLLVAESELNRAQLVQEWQIMRVKSARSHTRREPSVPSLPPPRRWLPACCLSGAKRSAPAAEKPPWWQTILKGAGLVSTLWQSFRPPGRNSPDK